MNKHESGNTNFNTTNYNANNDIPPNYDAVAGGLLDNRANESTTYIHPFTPNIGWGNPNIPRGLAAAPPAQPPPPVVVYIEDNGYHGRHGYRGRRHIREYNAEQVPPECAKCFRTSQFVIVGLVVGVLIIVTIVATCLSFAYR